MWRPLWSTSLTSPVSMRRPGWMAFSRVDFPTPEGPVTTLVAPASWSASSSSPIPSRADT